MILSDRIDEGVVVSRHYTDPAIQEQENGGSNNW